MKRDIRDTACFRKSRAFGRHCDSPARVRSATRRRCTPHQTGSASFSRRRSWIGSKARPPTRFALTELATGDTRVLTFGPNVDRLPKFSPDGSRIAFLSDRKKTGDFQLYLLDPVTGAAGATVRVEGWVEYFHWAPDGKFILLGVAGHGADRSAGQGAVTSKQAAKELPSWMPAVETNDETFRWRGAWIYELATDKVRRVSRDDTNVWEATWCGQDALAAVVSPGPGEGLWYEWKHRYRGTILHASRWPLWTRIVGHGLQKWR